MREVEWREITSHSWAKEMAFWHSSTDWAEIWVAFQSSLPSYIYECIYMVLKISFKNSLCTSKYVCCSLLLLSCPSALTIGTLYYVFFILWDNSSHSRGNICCIFMCLLHSRLTYFSCYVFKQQESLVLLMYLVCMDLVFNKSKDQNDSLNWTLLLLMMLWTLLNWPKRI